MAGDFKVTVKLQAVKADITQLRKEVRAAFATPIPIKFSVSGAQIKQLSKAVSAATNGFAGSFNGANKSTELMKQYGKVLDVNAKKSRAETAAINTQTAAIKKQQAALKLVNAQNAQAQRLITQKTQAIRTDTQFRNERSNLQAWANKYADNIKERGRDGDVASLISKLGSQSNFADGFAQAKNEVVALKSELRDLGVEAQSAAKQANVQSTISTDFNKLSSQAQNYYEEHARGIEKNTELSAKWADMRKKLDDPNIAKTGNIAKMREEYSALIRETEKAGAHLETVGQKLGRLFGAHFDTALVMFALHALQQSLMQVYQNVVQLDGAMVDLQIASGMSRDDVRGLMTTYNKMAKELGATTLEMAQGGDTFLRQGKTIEETNTLVRNSMMLSKLGQLESSESSKYLTSTMKGYKIAVEDTIDIVDKLTAVDMSAAVGAGDIAEALSGTAVSANIAGVSLDKLVGYIATVGEVTQTSGDEIGTFYRSLFARMGRIKSSELIDPETGDVLNIWGITA